MWCCHNALAGESQKLTQALYVLMMYTHWYMSSSSEPIEPEILNPGGNNAGSNPETYRARYKSYSHEVKQGSPAVFILSIIAFFLSLIPVIGVSLAILAMIFAKMKHTSMILASIAFIIGCVSTTLFVLLVLLLRLLF